MGSEHPWAETARQAREMKMLNICGSLIIEQTVIIQHCQEQRREGGMGSSD
jgi:hypothetical protein